MALDSLGISEESTTVGDAATRLDELCDRVADGTHAVIIRRRGKKPVVLFSAAELSSLCETVYVLSDPAAARRIFDALESADSGEGVELSIEDLRRFAGLAASASSERAS
jgi:antitoxin YefM